MLALSCGPSSSFDFSVINSATVYLSVWYKVEIELSVNSYVVWDWDLAQLSVITVY